MQAAEILAENDKNIRDTISFQEPNKIPIGIEIISWPFAYAGVTYKSLVNKPKEAAAAYNTFFDDIPLDYMWLPAGSSRPIEAYRILGSNNFVWGPDDTTIGHAQGTADYMRDDEYDEFIKDPYLFQKEKLTRRKLPAFTLPREDAYKKLLQALDAYENMDLMNSLIMDKVNEKGISLMLRNGPRFNPPLDMIFDKVRGFKNTLIDLRRRPEKVEAACARIFEIDRANEKPIDSFDPSSMLCIGQTVYHSACFLNKKQFEHYFMNYLKKGYIEFFKKGGHMFLKGESKFLWTLESFRDLPKGAMVIMLEEDDPYAAFKEIGDYQTLATGIKNSMLKYSSKQECIDYVKKCYDTFAPGGGFLFLNDKSLLGFNDADPKNVVAVYNFANEYGRKN